MGTLGAVRKAMARVRRRDNGAASPTLSGAQRRQWEEDGLLVLPGFFSPDRLARIDALLNDLWDTRADSSSPLTLDVPGARSFLRDAPDSIRQGIYKLNDLYLEEADLRNIVLDDGLVAVLRDLIDGAPAVCNSLNFERGSTQPLHVDTYYMPPPAGGRLVVTSICLEEVQPDAGPVTYIRGSHLIPPWLNSAGTRHTRTWDEEHEASAYMRAEAAQRGLETEVFLGGTGDVLIWHEQLFHGGSPIEDLSRTRKSLVTHYWRSDEMVGSDLRPCGDGFWIARPHQVVTNAGD